MMYNELKEKDERGFSFSEGHLSGGIRAIDIVLRKLKEEGMINPVEQDVYQTLFFHEWDKLNSYGLGEIEEY